MTIERHLLIHYFFQTNEEVVVVASKQNKFFNSGKLVVIYFFHFRHIEFWLERNMDKIVFLIMSRLVFCLSSLNNIIFLGRFALFGCEQFEIFALLFSVLVL
jgi:hypothetical protein